MALSQVRIAIVDDDDAVRKALGRVLRCYGADVTGFASGEEFLAALASASFDCTILDLHLPGLTGFQVQAELSAMRDAPPVILITAFDDDETRTRALEQGAIAFFHKPFECGSLVEAVALATGRELRLTGT
jgi:FixJ family two-component response regulator